MPNEQTEVGQESPPERANREELGFDVAEGPEAGLAIVDRIDASGSLAGYHLLPATRADLLRRLGRYDEAALSYGDALAGSSTDAERRYLTRRLAEVTAAGG